MHWHQPLGALRVSGKPAIGGEIVAPAWSLAWLGERFPRLCPTSPDTLGFLSLAVLTVGYTELVVATGPASARSDCCHVATLKRVMRASYVCMYIMYVVYVMYVM